MNKEYKKKSWADIADSEDHRKLMLWKRLIIQLLKVS